MGGCCLLLLLGFQSYEVVSEHTDCFYFVCVADGEEATTLKLYKKQ